MPLNRGTGALNSFNSDDHEKYCGVSRHALPSGSSSGNSAASRRLFNCWDGSTFFPGALRGHADFRQLYAAGYMVRTGHASELYDTRAQQQFQDALVGNDERALPFIRPAYQALLFVPFSLLPYRSAYLAFLAVNLVLLAMAFWLIPTTHEKPARDMARPARLRISGFLSDRTRAHAGAGFHSAAGAARGRSGCPRPGTGTDGRHAGGAGIVQNANRDSDRAAVFVVAALAILRRIRALGRPGSLISLWVVGFAQTAAYARSLFSVGTNVAAAHQFPLRVSIMANLRGLIFGLLGARLPAFWIQAVTIVFPLPCCSGLRASHVRSYRGGQTHSSSPSQPA